MVCVVIDGDFDLMPCPFCGSADLHIETDSEPSCYQVVCDNLDCEAMGPSVAMSADAAAALWNTRNQEAGKS